MKIRTDDREVLRLCASCGRRLDRSDATFYRGRHWCREHFRAQLGLDSPLDRPPTRERLIFLGVLVAGAVLYVAIRWLNSTLT